jgi:hypothetical protein
VTFCMSRSRLLGHLVGPVLPSVVAQALPWCLFVVGDLSLSLSSSDTDGGYQ